MKTKIANMIYGKKWPLRAPEIIHPPLHDGKADDPMTWHGVPR
jgi:hypothetical protein